MSTFPAIVDSQNSTAENFAHLAKKMLIEIGEDPAREGLLRTPARFQRAMQHLTAGYAMTPREAVGEGIFAEDSPGAVCLKDIEFFSLCEHHILPFWGKASIVYIPQGKILGISKLARVLTVFARRLQVQERLTKEVADSIYQLINAKGVAVVIEAQHMCMMMRGVEKQSSKTRTEYMIGSNNLSDLEQARLWRQLEP